jgi:hypothetical protein
MLLLSLPSGKCARTESLRIEIMETLEVQEARQVAREGHEIIGFKLYAGYENGYYYIRLDGDVKMATIASLQMQGYQLRFLEPPFGKPIMLKKR